MGIRFVVLPLRSVREVTAMSISIRNSEGYLDLTAYHALCRIEREEKGKSRRKYMPKVYIISPFAGDVERNTANARRYCFFAVKHIKLRYFTENCEEV